MSTVEELRAQLRKLQDEFDLQAQELADNREELNVALDDIEELESQSGFAQVRREKEDAEARVRELERDKQELVLLRSTLERERENFRDDADRLLRENEELKQTRQEHMGVKTRQEQELNRLREELDRCVVRRCALEGKAGVLPTSPPPLF